MKRYPLMVTVFVPWLALPGQVNAGTVTPLGSDRSVSVLNRVTIPATQMAFSGPAFGNWQASAFALNDPTTPGGSNNPQGSLLAVTSSQNSTFSASGLTFSGFVFIDYSGFQLPDLGASATSRCDVMFHVAGSCDYQLQSLYSGTDFLTETMGTVFLRNDNTSQMLFSLTSSGSRSGTLATGDYTLSVLITGNSGGTSASQLADGRKQIDLVFSIPAPVSGGILVLAFGALARRRRRPAC